MRRCTWFGIESRGFMICNLGFGGWGLMSMFHDMFVHWSGLRRVQGTDNVWVLGSRGSFQIDWIERFSPAQCVEDVASRQFIDVRDDDEIVGVCPAAHQAPHQRVPLEAVQILLFRIDGFCFLLSALRFGRILGLTVRKFSSVSEGTQGVSAVCNMSV
jgi:hypothetical protein